MGHRGLARNLVCFVVEIAACPTLFLSFFPCVERSRPLSAFPEVLLVCRRRFFRSASLRKTRTSTSEPHHRCFDLSSLVVLPSASMSLTAPLARLDRYGFVNTFILALVIAPLLPSALADVVASVLLATFVVVGTARRAGRRQWSTWVAAGVLALRIGSCFQCTFSPPPARHRRLSLTPLPQAFTPSWTTSFPTHSSTSPSFPPNRPFCGPSSLVSPGRRSFTTSSYAVLLHSLPWLPSVRYLSFPSLSMLY